MITIGNYEVVFSQHLLVPKGQTVFIDQDDGMGNDFKVRLKFEEEEKPEDEEDNRKPKFRSEADNDCGVLIFTNWNRQLGSSIQEPIPFAMMDSGRELSILANIAFSGHLYRANIQFMLALEGGKDE